MVSEYSMTECGSCNKNIPEPDVDGIEFNSDEKLIIYRSGMNYGEYETYCSIKCLCIDKVTKQWMKTLIQKLRNLKRKELKRN